MNEGRLAEEAGILVAGSVFLLGTVLQVPAVLDLVFREGVSVGELGVFLIVAYATGQVVATFGNVVANTVSLAIGASWDLPTYDPPRLLSAQQVQQVEERLRGRLGLKVDRIVGIGRADWRPIAERIYFDVLGHDPGRLRSNYAAYCLNRDLGAALAALAAITVLASPDRWPISVGLAAITLVFVFRMRELDLRFAREMFHRFLALPARPAVAQKPEARGGAERR